MNLENLLFKKISIWIVFLIIILSIISVFWFGYLVTKSNTALNIAKAPESLKNFFKDDIAQLEKRFGNKKGLNIYSPFSDEQYLLLSRYDGDLKHSVVELIDLKEKKIIHEWKPDINKINSFSKIPKERLDLKKNHNVKRYEIVHPFLFDNGDLLIHGNDSPLTKIDICSKRIWSLDYIFHHSIEMDHEKNLWIPFTYFPNSVFPGRLDEKLGIIVNHFQDDGIMKISPDGEILFKKSIIQIFLDNNLENIIYPGEITFDPTHVNDIQPVLFNSPHFKIGDVFLSLRSISLIVLYRPSTNKIIWFKKTPWIYQHDVDILNENQISIFNNKNIDNSFSTNKKNNNILIYDFNKKKVLNYYDALFKKYDIRTETSGLSEIMLDGSVFIEEANYGRLIHIQKEGKIIWEYINRANNGNLYPLFWSRLLKNMDKNFLEQLESLNCNEK